MKEMAKAAELVGARDPQRRQRQPATRRRAPRKLVAQLADIRRITQRNADGVEPTRGGTADLIEAGAHADRVDEPRRKAVRPTAATRPVTATAMNTAPTLGVVTTDRHLAIRGWNEWVAAATGVVRSRRRSAARCWTSSPRSVLDFYRDLLAEVLERGSARVLAPAFHHYLIDVPAAQPSDALHAHAAARHRSRR